MSQVTYMAPINEVRGKLSLNRGNDSLIVTRRKCFGKTKNGTPILGPKEMYTYRKHKGQWSQGAVNNRQLFKLAQQQALTEMQIPERIAHWQILFEEQLNHPKLGEKQYIKLQCFITAQLLKNMKMG
jgi:hypothetical protein